MNAPRSLPLPGLALVGPKELARELGLYPPTDEQCEVIAAPTEPALVVAGAGAGKTETMAGRVVWLVANGLVTPERVLGLTFTRKAARQLADRVRARLRRLAGSRLLDHLDPTGERRAAVFSGEPTILTYHAYAGRLVAEHGLRLPVEPGARLLTETASWQLAHRVVSTWAQDLDTDLVPATITRYLLALAGELSEHLVDPARLAAHAEAVCAAVESAPRAKGQRANLSQDLQKILVAQRFRVALLPLVEAYAERKRREGALDFGDQMSLAARLAESAPEVADGERQRYGAVLLDEYQDTGHAQRVLLRSLFGLENPMPVTAVGDPAQAIYGWRGASAANLPRFTTDFPTSVDGRLRPAARYGLLTSFRNPAEVLELANAVSAPLRAGGLEVDELRARDGADPGDIRLALLTDVDTEVQWVANQVADRWYATVEERGTPPTAAVLVRRRADMAELATALRERGLPVEVVGLGGLLDEPEVRDLVSTLRVLIDPLAGTAAARLLTGSRWRVGAADLAALWRRAGALSGEAPAQGGPADAVPGEAFERAGLVDAIDDPGPRQAYSEPGYQRIRALAAELTALRRRLDQPLPDLVADVERTMRLDIEATARRGGAGRAHLDAFADVVADYAHASPSASLPALLDYLATAEVAEDGLDLAEVEVAENRVQVVTVHSAKGLEWEVVAVPHLVTDVFPSGRRGGSWLRTVTELPADLRGDAADLPRLNLAGAADRKQVEQELKAHNEAFAERGLLEERRLFYVAVTRSERCLLVSGHWWGRTGTKPKGPSEFLTDLKEHVAAWPADTVDVWSPEPLEGEENPLAAAGKSARWPLDPLGDRREDVAAGAAMVRAELAAIADGDTDDPPADDPDGWVRDTDVLLAERAAAARRTEEVVLPDQLSVSQLVELAADPAALARRLRRPLPYPPNPTARRGTAFHTWLERRFGSRALLDLDELPGAADADAAPDEDLHTLQTAFLASPWADKTPHEVEVPFATDIAGTSIRGRMDAVFPDPDGGWTVIDWKTGRIPDDDRLPALTVQLAAYRLAWAALSDTPLDKVRAAFHYVRHNHTLRPADLLDENGIRTLLHAVPTPGTPPTRGAPTPTAAQGGRTATTASPAQGGRATATASPAQGGRAAATAGSAQGGRTADTDRGAPTPAQDERTAATAGPAQGGRTADTDRGAPTPAQDERTAATAGPAQGGRTADATQGAPIPTAGPAQDGRTAAAQDGQAAAAAGARAAAAAGPAQGGRTTVVAGAAEGSEAATADPVQGARAATTADSVQDAPAAVRGGRTPTTADSGQGGPAAATAGGQAAATAGLAPTRPRTVGSPSPDATAPGPSDATAPAPGRPDRGSPDPTAAAPEPAASGGTGPRFPGPATAGPPDRAVPGSATGLPVEPPDEEPPPDLEPPDDWEPPLDWSPPADWPSPDWRVPDEP